MEGAQISDGYAYLYVVGSLVREEEHKALAMARMLYYNINQIPHPKYPTALWLPPLEQRQFSVEEVKIAGRLIYESLDKATQDIELLKYEALCSREADLMTADELNVRENWVQRDQEALLSARYHEVLSRLDPDLAEAIHKWVGDLKEGMMIREGDFVESRARENLDAKDDQFRFCSSNQELKAGLSSCGELRERGAQVS